MREVAIDPPRDRSDRERAARTAQKLSLAEAAAGDTEAALRTARTSVSDLRDALDMAASLAAALNNVAWFSLLSGASAGGLEAANGSVEREPEAKTCALIRAHALMFSGDADVARAIYFNVELTSSDGWPDIGKWTHIITARRVTAELALKYRKGLSPAYAEARARVPALRSRSSGIVRYRLRSDPRRYDPTNDATTQGECRNRVRRDAPLPMMD
ncbi:hypothetical protein G5B40_05685 [Pikeienuella piscinae]|uniref:Uncharacterized protein n=1 Tax=Pikeienuella piscinae TaxID=2748098 RepID=A0A7L5BZF9_9RHOB|nr:hypothetical protein [Pikeienuella piscinae]QIE54989.1 hypothetical protein G5B40_05685 [Pikeienuella piscinae]